MTGGAPRARAACLRAPVLATLAVSWIAAGSAAFAQPGARESTRTETVPSALVPRAVRTRVLTPPSYDSSPERRYPVLYFLHDGRGDEDALFSHGVAAELLDAMRAGRMPEVLVVSPRGVGTWFVDSYDGRTRYASFLTRELVPFIDARYRTIPERRARAAAGISMGGYGAIRWGMKEPGLFAVVGGLSPAVQQLNWDVLMTLPFYIRRTFTRVFGKSETANNLKENDLYDIVLSDPSLASRGPEVLARCGTEDRYRLWQNAAFLGKFLSAAGVRNEVVLEPGRHAWTYWKGALPTLLEAIAARIGAASPSHGSAP